LVMSERAKYDLNITYCVIAQNSLIPPKYHEKN